MKGDRLFLKQTGQVDGRRRLVKVNIRWESPRFKTNPDCDSNNVFLFEYINKAWIKIKNSRTKMAVINKVGFLNCRESTVKLVLINLGRHRFIESAILPKNKPLRMAVWKIDGVFSNPLIKKVKEENFSVIHIGLVQNLFLKINSHWSCWKLSTLLLRNNVRKRMKMHFRLIVVLIRLIVVAGIVDGWAVICKVKSHLIVSFRFEFHR